jgi:hypothetical protein
MLEQKKVSLALAKSLFLVAITIQSAVNALPIKKFTDEVNS